MTNIDSARAEAEKLLPCIQHCLERPHKAEQDASYHFAACPAHYREPVAQALTALMVERDADVADKDEAYRQRNHLVAAMARLFPSGIRPTNIEGWSANWHGCVYIDLPVGQISYHYHDSQQMLFEDLPPYEKVYDGHDKDAVHERLEALWFAARNATEVRLHKNMELARHDGIVEARNAIRELRSELGAHPTDWQHANNLDHAIARIESPRALRRPDAPANTEMPGEDWKSDVDDDSAWIIWFEDPEKSLQMFSRNGATNAAYRVYEMLRQSWSCHLFKRIHGEGDKPLPATPMHVEQLRAKVVEAVRGLNRYRGWLTDGTVIPHAVIHNIFIALDDLQTKERDLGT